MQFRFVRLPLALTLSFLTVLPAFGEGTETPFTAADIEAAEYHGGDLPSGRSALTAKVQVLLDRSGTSPGVIDGYRGGMSESAIRAFERRAGLPMDGRMDMQVWQLLLPYAIEPQTMNYTITEADARDLVDEIPNDYAEKAKMAKMGYTSIAERLGERFHMDEKFIAFLNPDRPLKPGSTITVTAPAKPIKTKVTRIIVDKSTRRVAAYNQAGDMIADYPATVGSDATPSPAGTHKVVTVALDPNYTYNPQKNFKQGDNDKPLIVPPGPNGPVGSVWIDLTKPSYGIHGTPTPSRLFRNQSNGCVRLTNWDARELSGMVIPGKTVVEFLTPGVTIADVTDGAHKMTETLAKPYKETVDTGIKPQETEVALAYPTPRPLPRPAHIGYGPAATTTAIDPVAAATAVSDLATTTTQPATELPQPQPVTPSVSYPETSTGPDLSTTERSESAETPTAPTDDLLSDALSDVLSDDGIVPVEPRASAP